MRLNILFITILGLFSIGTYAQKKDLQNIRALRNILTSQIVYSDSARSARQFECVIVGVALESGKPTDIHVWCRDDSRIKDDILKVSPIIKEKWSTKDTAIRYVYIPLMITFSIDNDELLKSKGFELIDLLKMLAGARTKESYFDKVEMVNDGIGRKVY
jgi:hypothetical protein